MELVRARRVERDRADVALLVSLVDWAVAHEVAADDPRAACLDSFAGDVLALAGEGAPSVAEFAAYEVAAALNVSTSSGLAQLGRALELRYRLPKLWQRVVDGDLSVWRAGAVADSTRLLSLKGAAYVDTHLAPVAHKLSWAQQQRTVEKATALFDPELAAQRAAEAADRRFFDVGLENADLTGVVAVSGMVDLTDAIDLETAVAQTATALLGWGCEETRNVRRSMAVGEMARQQLALELRDAAPPSVDGDGERVPAQGTRSHTRGRAITMFLHLDATGVAECETTGTNVLIEQIRRWCGAGGNQVVLKPLKDLAACEPVEAYAVPRRHAEQVELRDRTCVFPFCTVRATRCDKDHVTAHADGGATCPCNLAPLCRRHHRAKTHSAWTYVTLDPGVYLWSSPNRLSFLRDRYGTTSLPER